MKKLSVLALLLVSASASAGTTVITRQPEPRYSLEGSRWGLNVKMGRAWVDLTWRDSEACKNLTYQSPNCDLIPFVHYRVKGLSYDAATHRIVHDDAGKLTVCANVEMGRKVRIRSTGECRVQGIKTRVTVDDGFVTREKRVIEVRLETR